jgi:hypothetical protein
MRRAVDDLLGEAVLDHTPGIHDGDALCQLNDCANIMRDQKHGGAERIRNLLDLPKDTFLNQHIKSSRRLVHNEKLRLQHQCRGNHHALAHAAGKFVRELVHETGLEADQIEELPNPLARRASVDFDVGAHRFMHLGADAPYGIERILGALGNKRHPLHQHLPAKGVVRQTEKVDAHETEDICLHIRRSGQQTEERLDEG